MFLLLLACTAEPPVEEATDTDDTEVFTGCVAREETCDGRDEDCDGVVDEGVTQRWYRDADGDGWAGTEAWSCQVPLGAGTEALDCDDADATVHPGQQDPCDEVDADCDEVIDEDPDLLWYVDGDGDGWAGTGTYACDAPAGAEGEASDCDDADADVYPGADETCDGKDNDCDERTVDTGLVWTASDGSTTVLDNGGAYTLSAGTLQLCPGSYWLTLTLDDDVRIVGAGDDTVLGGSADADYGSGTFESLTLSGFSAAAFYYTLTWSSVVMSGVTLSANRYGTHALSDATVTGLTGNFQGGGISLSSSTVSASTLNLDANSSREGSWLSASSTVFSDSVSSCAVDLTYDGTASFSAVDFVDNTAGDVCVYGTTYTLGEDYTGSCTDDGCN